MLMNVQPPAKSMPSISPQQAAQQLIQAQLLQQAGAPSLASVPPSPSLFIQLHHLVQLQQVQQWLLVLKIRSRIIAKPRYFHSSLPVC